MTPTLDSRQLRAFAALARTGSFTDAARELHLTQSAISHAIKALEGDVRCRLFDRVGKQANLTQAGEHLLAHTEKILREMAAAREGLAQLGKWGHGRLRIGASTTACQYILPAVLREFKEKFPRCLIHIEPADTPKTLELLRAQRIDLALTMEPKHETRFEFRPLFTDELQFIVGANHPWAVAGKATRAEIPREKYALYNRASFTFKLVEEYFRAEGIVLDSFIELGSMDAIKELVKIGVGISILAPWVAAADVANGTLVALPLGRRKLKRRWGILHWRGRRFSLPEETFIAGCKTATASFRR